MLCQVVLSTQGRQRMADFRNIKYIMVITGKVLYYKMPTVSKAKKQRLEAAAKARAQNPKNTSLTKTNDSNYTQLEISNNSESDTTPEDLIFDNAMLQVSESYKLIFDRPVTSDFQFGILI